MKDDLQIIMPHLDNLVLALHNRGIDRQWTMRVSYGVAVLSAFVCGQMRGDQAWLDWLAAIIWTSNVLLQEYHLHRFGVRWLNQVILHQRSALPLTIIRVSMMALLVIAAPFNFPWGLDSIPLILAVYLSYTFVPTDPPKRQEKRALQFANSVG